MAVGAVGPAGVVPVPAQVGSVEGYDDDVAGAGRDVLVAARADVALRGLVRLDASNLDVVHAAQPSKAQATKATQMTTAAATIR
jgi:hypothetical protein